MRELVFAALTEEHLDAVREIDALSQSAPWSEVAFRREIGRKDGTFLVALLAGQVVGFGGLWLLVDEAHIIDFAVHPEHRRQGIGRALLTELLRRARAAGMECAKLEVRAGNEAALGLYEGFGFVRQGFRRAYYPDNGEDAVVMWLPSLAESPAS